MVEYCDTLHTEREEQQGIQSIPKEGDHIMSTRQIGAKNRLDDTKAGAHIHTMGNGALGDFIIILIPYDG